MAEKLISRNWVDPRQRRQAPQWCWLGMGCRCLSRTGAPVSAGTAAPPAPRTGSVPHPLGWVPVQRGRTTCWFARSFWGPSDDFYCLLTRHPSIVPCPELEQQAGHRDPKRWPGPPVSAWASRPQFGRNPARRPAQPCRSGPGEPLRGRSPCPARPAAACRRQSRCGQGCFAPELRGAGFGTGVSGCKRGFQRLPCFLRRISGTKPKASPHPHALPTAGFCPACSTSLQLQEGMGGLAAPRSGHSHAPAPRFGR